MCSRKWKVATANTAFQVVSACLLQWPNAPSGLQLLLDSIQGDIQRHRLPQMGEDPQVKGEVPCNQGGGGQEVRSLQEEGSPGEETDAVE